MPKELDRYLHLQDLSTDKVYQSYMGNAEKALEHLGLFSRKTTYLYLVILFLGMDHLIVRNNDDPEFIRYLQQMELNF